MANEDYFPVELRQDRPRCPFYGFAIGCLIDTNGNQCGLILDSIHPCKMEVNGYEVDFDNCRLNTEEVRRYFDDNADEIRVHLDDLKSDKGVTFRIWKEFVMGRE